MTMNVMEALEAAVAERGADYVYPQDDWAWRIRTDYSDKPQNAACRYLLEDGTPACIVGVALTKMGYDLTPVKDLALSAYDLPEYIPGLELSKAESEALNSAQEYQDVGDTWGAALEAAKEGYKDA